MEEALEWILDNVSTLMVDGISLFFAVVASLPLLIFRLIGTFTPSCDQSSITSFPVTLFEGVASMISVFWPLISFLPWEIGFQLFAACILYKVVRVVVRWLPVAWNYVVTATQWIIDFFWPF